MRGDRDLEANPVDMIHGSPCLELLTPEVVCNQVERISHAVLTNLLHQEATTLTMSQCGLAQCISKRYAQSRSPHSVVAQKSSDSNDLAACVSPLGIPSHQGHDTQWFRVGSARGSGHTLLSDPVALIFKVLRVRI